MIGASRGGPRGYYSCSITGNRLACANPVVKATWKASIVPEAIARKADPKALTDALAAGLRSLTVAAQPSPPIFRRRL